ncbi:MAG: ABC transporter ATP-binding protein [Candidatus Bathyarchaeota archaeon]|nr:MAG: ABC transporter ATP-binding protein [Candidatus Bathyarchaeota archaeon]
MSALLEVRNIAKSYGAIQALQDVNLKILRGKITVLLGPSGSGKTTLLRILAGLEKPSHGSILCDGEDIAEDSDLLRQKATMVFQKSVFFNAAVYKNVAYGLKVKGYSNSQIKDSVRKALQTVRLEGFENRRTRNLSGGEQQRVSIARALILERELLLLDEPTVNIDPRNVSIIEATILRVNRNQKMTIVLATHNMFQAEALSERVAILLEGTVRQVGTNQQIFGTSNKHLASVTRLDNVFSGVSRINKTGTSVIKVSENLRIEASFRKSGEATIYIKPEDIIVSAHPFTSSARNVFQGSIIEVSDLGSVMKLRVNAEKKFLVQITKRSFTEMGLNVGSTVFLTFKASSVQHV